MDPECVDAVGGSHQGKVRGARGNPPYYRYQTKFGTTEGTFGVQLVRFQSDDGGEYIHEALIK
eukprot:9090128-Prorocentrum_lima.AAC.1